MKTRTVKRHNCDFCGKGYFFLPAIKRHEKGCTRNPNRVCGMCEMAQNEQKSIAELDALLIDCDMSVDYGHRDEKINEDVIRRETQGCPACILSVLRQTKKAALFTIDWKAESKAWLDTFSRYTADYR